MNGQDQPLPSPSQVARVRYRLRQFVRGLSARVDAEEQAAALQRLPVDARPLFVEMPRDARRHSLNVLATLQAAGYDDADLWAAALLHDMGKTAAQEAGVHIGLWARGPLVLAEAAAPGWLHAQARPQPNAGWRYAVHVQLEHPRIGAERARAAGCSELTCWLIAHHQDEEPKADEPGANEYRQQLLTTLQWADGLN